jgi:hypothetical protein
MDVTAAVISVTVRQDGNNVQDRIAREGPSLAPAQSLSRGRFGFRVPGKDRRALATNRGLITEKYQTHRENFHGQRWLELFEELILPHVDAAYNLARYLMRSEPDALDVVKEPYLRAFGCFDSYRGGNGKAWLLAVVPNTCRTWQRRQNKESASVPFDEVVRSSCRHPNRLQLQALQGLQLQLPFSETNRIKREPLRVVFPRPADFVTLVKLGLVFLANL